MNIKRRNISISNSKKNKKKLKEDKSTTPKNDSNVIEKKVIDLRDDISADESPFKKKKTLWNFILLGVFIWYCRNMDIDLSHRF